MAPNVKQLHLLASSLADIQVVQAKYMPLTHASVSVQQQVTPSASTPAQNVEASASYWEWSAPTTVADVPIAITGKKDLFSSASMEANLIQDSQRVISEDVVVSIDTESDNDSYWQERVEESAVDMTEPQHDDYWYSPANPEEAHIQAILNDEFARQSVSVETIEKNLLATSSQSFVIGQVAANDDYWTEAKPVSRSLEQVYSENYWSTEKVAVVSAILAEEECRRAVSLVSIEKNIQASILPACGQTKASSDAHWGWSHDAKPSDSYWDNAAPAAVGHQAGYWDM